MKHTMLKTDSHTYIKVIGAITLSDVKTLKIILKAAASESKPVIFDMRFVKAVHYKTGLLIRGLRRYYISRCLSLKIICTDPYILSVLSLFDYEVLYDTTKDLHSARNLVELKL